MYSEGPRQEFNATPGCLSWEGSLWGVLTACPSRVAVKSSIVQWGHHSVRCGRCGGKCSKESQVPLPSPLGSWNSQCQVPVGPDPMQALQNLISHPGPGHVSAGPDLLIQLSGLSVNLSYPTEVTGDLTCCLTLADNSEPALLTLLRQCGSLLNDTLLTVLPSPRSPTLVVPQYTSPIRIPQQSSA